MRRSMSESDGVEEAVDGGLRVAMTAAARVVETLVRVRQQHQIREAEASEERARALAGRLETEMTAARTAYQGVDDPQWWTTAQVDDVATAYREAAAWRDVDPDAARAEQRIVDEVRARYDVDVRELQNAPIGTRLTEASEELMKRDTLDVGESTRLLVAAERSDRAPEPSQVDWDSAERREATASALSERVKDPEAVEAVMRADTAQARPASEAVSGRAYPAKVRGRTSSGAGRQRERQRGLSR